MKEINIDGVIYVEKHTQSNRSIIRTQNAGVFFAEVELTIPHENGKAKLVNSRRLWFWSGAASLSQLALEGVKKPNECKFPAPLPTQTVFGVIEIIPCTEAACKSIDAVKVWQM